MGITIDDTATNGALTAIADAVKISNKDLKAWKGFLTDLQKILNNELKEKVSIPGDDYQSFIQGIKLKETPSKYLAFKADKQYPFEVTQPPQVTPIYETLHESLLVLSSSLSDIFNIQLDFPSTVFRPQDYQNYRYWDKFICLLYYVQGIIEQNLSTTHDLQWTVELETINRAPILRGIAKDLLSIPITIHITIGLPEFKTELKRLRPNKSALKTATNPTPHYNAITLSHLCAASISKSISDSISDIVNFDKAGRLLKVWAYNKFHNMTTLGCSLRGWHLIYLLNKYCADNKEIASRASVLQLLILFLSSLSRSSDLHMTDINLSSHDWAWEILPSIHGELCNLAQEGLECLQGGRADRLHCFLQPRKLIETESDAILYSGILSRDVGKHNGLLAVQAATEAAATILQGALSSHIRYIIPRFRVETRGVVRAIIGLKFISDDMKLCRTVLEGPNVEDEVGVSQFRTYWGDKVYEQQLADGRTIVAINWIRGSYASNFTMNEIIGKDRDATPSPVTQALLYLCSTQQSLSLYQMNIESWWRVWDDIINDPYEREIDRSMMEFRSRLSSLKGEGISTSLGTLHYVCSNSRHLNVPFPKRCRFMWANQGSLIDDYDPEEAGRQIIECVLEIESSSRWPRDRTTLSLIKTGVLLQIQRSLSSSSSVDDDPINSCISRDGDYLDVLFTPSIIFRLRLTCPLDFNINTCWFINTRLPIPDGGIKSIDYQLIELVRQNYWRPSHAALIEASCQKYPSLPGTIRLVKRWVGAQWVTSQDLSEFWELLVLHIYERQFGNEATRIQTPNSGFWSLMNFLSQRVLSKQAIFIGDYEMVKPALIKAWENSKKLPMSKAIWISSSLDPYSIFLNGPTQGEYKRLVCFARAIVKLGENPTLSQLDREIFTLGLAQFDSLILLTPPRTLLQSLFAKKQRTPKNLISKLKGIDLLFGNQPSKHIFPQKGQMLHAAFELAYKQLENDFAGLCLFSRNPWNFPYAMMIGVNFVTRQPADFKKQVCQILGELVWDIVIKGEDEGSDGVWRRAKEQLSFF